MIIVDYLSAEIFLIIQMDCFCGFTLILEILTLINFKCEDVRNLTTSRSYRGDKIIGFLYFTEVKRKTKF